MRPDTPGNRYGEQRAQGGNKRSFLQKQLMLTSRVEALATIASANGNKFKERAITVDEPCLARTTTEEADGISIENT